MDYKKCFDFVRKCHGTQVHANNVPVWHHIERVSKRLEYFFNLYQEGDVKSREIIVCSALGHDLLEDTKVDKKEILELFGDKGLELIMGMTNEWGDDDVVPYVEKVRNGLEEVRLIKLSDLCDNITAVSYNIAVLSPKWTKEKFLPIVTPMKEAVLLTPFNKYPKTADALKLVLNAAFIGLQQEINRF